MSDWHKETELKTAADLEALLRAGFLQRPPLRIVARFEHLGTEQNEALSRQLNRYYNACGCGEGRVFVLGALLSWCVYAIANDTFFWSWENAGLAFLWCLAGAFIGKAIGLVLAWRQLRRLVRTQQAVLPTSG